MFLLGLVIGVMLMIGWYYLLTDPPLPEDPPSWAESPYADQVIELDHAVLMRLAHPERMQELGRREPEVLADLREDLAIFGVLEPLELVIDQTGKATLRDGHHRLLAGEGVIARYPVRITTSEQIRGFRAPLVEVLPDLLRSAAGR